MQAGARADRRATQEVAVPALSHSHLHALAMTVHELAGRQAIQGPVSSEAKLLMGRVHANVQMRRL